MVYSRTYSASKYKHENQEYSQKFKSTNLFGNPKKILKKLTFLTGGIYQQINANSFYYT